MENPPAASIGAGCGNRTQPVTAWKAATYPVGLTREFGADGMDLNLRPSHYKWDALPSELRQHLASVSWFEAPCYKS